MNKINKMSKKITKATVKNKMKKLIALRDKFLSNDNTGLLKDININKGDYEELKDITLEDKKLFKPMFLKYQFIVETENVNNLSYKWFENMAKAVAKNLEKPQNMFSRYEGSFKDEMEENKLAILVSDDYINEGFGDGICGLYDIDGIQLFIKIRPAIPTTLKYTLKTEGGKKYRVYKKPYVNKKGEEKTESIIMPNKSVKNVFGRIVIDVHIPSVIDVKENQIEETKKNIVPASRNEWVELENENGEENE